MSSSINNWPIEANLGEYILVATVVSPMSPASINAVIPSLSAEFLISALYFCKSMTISKNLEEAAEAKALDW